MFLRLQILPPITTIPTFLHLGIQLFHRGHRRTWSPAFRWWTGIGVASSMSVNCNKLSLPGFTILVSGPFVSSCSSSRIHTNPSQLVANFSSNLSFLIVFLSWGFRCVDINWLLLVPFRRTKGICSTLELPWSLASEFLFRFFLYSFLSQYNQGSCYAMLWWIA